ncbi:uncharacterized protein JCM10292_006688, partial [Rhodotorula paludigena]|uniref:uncharacterized protein n=1 Tax=Rhodotorula paludigena TaxID=86838 RepID=UPI00317925F0
RPLLVPGISATLVSASQLFNNHLLKAIFGNLARLVRDNKVIATGLRTALGLYTLNGTLTPPAAGASALLASLSPIEPTTWHHRFAHLSPQSLASLSSSEDVMGSSWPKSSTRETAEPLKLVHLDVLTINVLSKSGLRYVVTFVDNHSRMLWTQVLALKLSADVLAAFQQFKARAELECGKPVKRLRSNNGGEYTSTAFVYYAAEHGIALESTRPYSPQTNGVAKRVNCTIVKGVLGFLEHAGAPKHLWAEALAAFTYMKNRSPHSALAGRVPLADIRFVEDEFPFSTTHSSADPPPTSGGEALIFTLSSILRDTPPVPLASGPSTPQRPAHARASAPSPPAPLRYRHVDVRKPTYDVAALSAAVGESLAVSDKAFSLPSSDPRAHADAVRNADAASWRQGKHNKFSLLRNNYGVYHVVDLASLPPGAKLLGCRFVCTQKKDQHGKVTGHKVRLVAQGFSQRPGVDFRETFAPVAKFTLIRTVLAHAARSGLLVHQADVDKAYLHGELDEEL